MVAGKSLERATEAGQPTNQQPLLGSPLPPSRIQEEGKLAVDEVLLKRVVEVLQ